MLNQENRNLLLAYGLTVLVAVVLIVLIANFNTWFVTHKNIEVPAFTPAARGIIEQKDLKLSLLAGDKFRSLGPLLTAEELKRIELEDRPVPGTVSGTTSGSVPGSITGTVRPPTVKHEVRHGNPFLPF